MKILNVTYNFSTPNLPIYGIVVKEQIESLSSLGIDNQVFFVNGYENSNCSLQIF